MPWTARKHTTAWWWFVAAALVEAAWLVALGWLALRG